jgi:hypothetical protein
MTLGDPVIPLGRVLKAVSHLFVAARAEAHRNPVEGLTKGRAEQWNYLRAVSDDESFASPF